MLMQNAESSLKVDLDKKGLIYIEPNPEYSDSWEDTVNESVFDMFEPIWDEIQSNPKNMVYNEYRYW